MLNHNLLSEKRVFYRSTGGRFSVSQKVMETLLDFVQYETQKPESGGVLLGRHILDTDDIVVDGITIPMSGDKQLKASFYRSRLLHQQKINDAWKESQGTCTYLGEWHTHPEPVPVPSFIDKINWGRKLFMDQFSEYLFFVILGTKSICVWEGYRRSIHLRQLRGTS